MLAKNNVPAIINSAPLAAPENPRLFGSVCDKIYIRLRVGIDLVNHA